MIVWLKIIWWPRTIHFSTRYVYINQTGKSLFFVAYQEDICVQKAINPQRLQSDYSRLPLRGFGFGFGFLLDELLDPEDLIPSDSALLAQASSTIACISRVILWAWSRSAFASARWAAILDSISSRSLISLVCFFPFATTTQSTNSQAKMILPTIAYTIPWLYRQTSAT